MKINLDIIKRVIIRLLIYSLIIFILYAISTPSFNSARPLTSKKSCIANMKTIEEAIKMYRKENVQPTVFTVSDLVTNGYLRTTPKCNPVVKNFFGRYTYLQPLTYKIVKIESNYQSVQVLFDIECDVHGRLSLQNSTDKFKGL